MAPSVMDPLHFEPLDSSPDRCRLCLNARADHGAEGLCPTAGADLLALLRDPPPRRKER